MICDPVTAGNRGFKALKQLVKILYKAKRYEEMLESYRSMLAYLEGTVVTKNASEKKVNSLLDFMGQVWSVWG